MSKVGVANSLIPVSEDLLKELLQPIQVGERQRGPLRWYDREMRCLSKRCGTPTYLKLNGVALCWKHAICKLNEMYVELKEGMSDRGTSRRSQGFEQTTEENEATSSSVGIDG